METLGLVLRLGIGVGAVAGGVMLAKHGRWGLGIAAGLLGAGAAYSGGVGLYQAVAPQLAAATSSSEQTANLAA